MGANHAAITFLRHPDLFRDVIALSGVYDSELLAACATQGNTTEQPESEKRTQQQFVNQKCIEP